MTTKLFSFFLLLCIVAGCTTTAQDDNQYYDTLINKYNKTGIAEVDAISNGAERKVIEHVFRALSHLRQNDSINEVTTSLFLESVAAVEKIDNIALKEWVYSEIGFYYYTYNYYYEAAPYFIKISKVIENKSILLDIQATSILMRTAYFFETMNMNDRAIIYYQKVLELTNGQHENNSATLWSLGAVYLKVDSLDQSIHNFNLAKDKSLAYNDTLRYAKSLGGIAQVYSKKGDLVKAESYLKEDIAISRQLGEEKNLMYSQIQLGKLYLQSNKLNLAEQSLKQSYEITKTISYLAGFQREITSYLLDIARIRGLDNQELFYRRELERIDSVIGSREGDEVINDINWKTSLEGVNWELEAEKNTSERIRYQRLLLLSISILLVLIVFIVYFFYKRIMKLQKHAYESIILEFQLAKVNSESKLKQTHASLASYQVYLSEKTQQIVKLERELQKVEHSSSDFVKNKRPVLEELLGSHLMTEDNWEMFKAAFKEEQREYFEDITTQFPDLTESNLRIVLLQKLGLTNQETANILGVTIEAIKKAKQRLKKKYEGGYQILFNKELFRDVI